MQAGRLACTALLLSQLVAGLPALAAPAFPSCDDALAAVRRQQGDLLAAMPRLQVLLLGETHSSAADHTWQLGTLEALQARRPLSLALEMIPAPRQPLLTRYGTGLLGDGAFLQQVGWQQVWGHDPDLYLPLLRWARQRQVPLLAINAEPELVRRVRREGLAAIPLAARQGIGIPAPATLADRQRLEVAWRWHRPREAAAPAADPADLERFISSQLLRERAMAERIAAAHRQAPDRLVVVLIGQGHLEAGGGVPWQLRHLGLTRSLALRRPEPPPGCGPAPGRARLGAFLESEGGQVWVRRVAPGSAAETGGIRAGDRILELNGTAVDHAGQVIRGVRLHPDGVPLRLLIERGGRRLRLELGLPPSGETRQAARDNGVWAGERSLPPTPRLVPTLSFALSPP